MINRKAILNILLVLFISVIFTGCSNEYNENINEPAADLPDIVNTNYNLGIMVVSDGTDTYVAHMHSVYKIEKSGRITSVTSDEGYINRVMLVGDRLYYCTVENMYSVNKDGTDKQHVLQMVKPDGEIIWVDSWVRGQQVYLHDIETDRDAILVCDENGVYAAQPADGAPIYVNSRNMAYKYILDNQIEGHLELINADGSSQQILPVGVILHENAVLVTDNYIFVLSGSHNDNATGITLYRFDLYGENRTEIAVIGGVSSHISMEGYDREYIYVLNGYDDKYYRFDQKTGELKILDIYYEPGVLSEICDGWLYRTYNLNPQRIWLETGMPENLIFE